MNLLLFAIVLLALGAGAQGKPDEAAIRDIVDEETVAWNKGDADAYSRHFAADGTFTNIQGMFARGHEAFVKQHELIFGGMFRGTVVKQEIVSVKFVRPDVAIVETLTAVSGFSSPPPGRHLDEKGRLRTRLLQVVVHEGGYWKIAAYHNTDIKPGVAIPEEK